jgi:uroporphyrinogen-III synthase
VSGLTGLRIALLEGRLPGELAALVRRHGGEPYSVPAVRDEPVAASAEVAGFLDRFREAPEPVVVLSTGVGVTALFAEARALGREPDLRQVLRRATLACRGPKPVAALHREGIEASIRAAEPYTTADLLHALAGIDLAGRPVAVLHYGERNLPLVDALTSRRGEVEELLLYAWRLPEDLGPLRQLVTEILERRVGAVVFTSQAQARHLFQIASEQVALATFERALLAHTVVVAIGPTCARALRDLGVPPHVVPDHPKMGAMIAALADHVSRSHEGNPR